MRKILVAINASNPDKNSLEFASYLGRLTNSKITGVFLENLAFEETLNLKTPLERSNFKAGSDEQIGLKHDSTELIEQNISTYKEAAANRGVNLLLHRDRGIPAYELIEESRFADMIVLDAATSFNKQFEGTPTNFIKDVLKNTECPVIIAPEYFEAIDEIVFTYDGSASSVFAIKQFTYLFPQ